MKFSSTAILFGLLALSSASPIKPKARRALTVRSYSEFQVSDGVAGNALAEVNAKFPIDQQNLASVSASDLQILKDAREVAEEAEVGTGGFNQGLAAIGSGGDTTALQNGKIKNKVLKLQLQVLALQIQAAQGNPNQAKLLEETTKLNNNVRLDNAAAGEKSVGVTATFSG